MPETIVKFDCRRCGIERGEAKVRCRRSKELLKRYIEDVVMRAIGVNHSRRSPRCLSRTFHSIMIPKDAFGWTDEEAARVGEILREEKEKQEGGLPGEG
jgi:hypothetical protein